MSTELVTITQASTIIGTLTNAATMAYSEIRLYGTVSAARRKALRDQIAAARASDVARALTSLGIENLQHTFDLFDLVETRMGRAGYENAHSQATHAARLLQDNLNNLARTLR